MGDLKFALAGYGLIGRRHAQVINELENSALVAVADPKSLEDIPHSVPVFRSLEELVQSGIKADVLSIATPNYLHCKQALYGLRNGMHVVLEKPMGLTSSECRLVMDEAERAGRQVFCVMQNRYSSPSAWLKNLVDSGRLGRIFYVQINCFWNRNAEYYHRSDWKGRLAFDGGTLFTQFSHFIDTILWVFGDITTGRAGFFNFNHPEIEFEDSGWFEFDILEGGKGMFHYSTSASVANLESSITILAENGTVKVGGQYMDQVIACNIPGYEMPELKPTNAPNDYGYYKGSASNHASVYRNVYNVLNGLDTIHTTAADGKKVVEVIERLYTGRKF